MFLEKFEILTIHVEILRSKTYVGLAFAKVENLTRFVINMFFVNFLYF